ncbi:NAD(+) diphosphatase [Alteromonas pelagimontana]|uniref:NAD(+) diphosphatase n=1 Tax=Alteromonas pelagimontana TaxID=1858656 RepID=A0A6M4MGP5_9ALTE|nr:NAD(+) diphosphatase [Alteromonas pelagimontana]QJR81376.1 NAD(+) diphosphatase [Alteromonas pelagimontana]
MMKNITPSQLAGAAGQWLIFAKDKVLVEAGTTSIPHKPWQELDFLHHYASEVRVLPPLVATTQGAALPVYLIDIGAENIEQPKWEAVPLRTILMAGSDDAFSIAGRAWQYIHFLRTHRFCGQCGAVTEQVDWEMAVHCHDCHHRSYPRISPCIIVAIYHQDSILLAKSVRHKNVNLYSTLAGFVESGETLEHAVHREVMEEVGVKIKNLSYFGSQPWPFPHSLMAGYLAEYESGDIVIDDNEIIDAKWFKLSDLPPTPPTLSIAGQLIEAVIKRK